jgi:hypothetical protein
MLGCSAKQSKAVLKEHSAFKTDSCERALNVKNGKQNI